MKSTKRFGPMLRAHRLGFREIKDFAFIRISAGGPPWLIEIAPFDVLATTKTGVEYVVWHDDPDLVLFLSATLTRIFKGIPPKSQVSIHLDDDGNLVQGEAT